MGKIVNFPLDILIWKHPGRATTGRNWIEGSQVQGERSGLELLS